jgi:hypothetical protein
MPAVLAACVRPAVPTILVAPFPAGVSTAVPVPGTTAPPAPAVAGFPCSTIPAVTACTAPPPVLEDPVLADAVLFPAGLAAPASSPLLTNPVTP